MRSPSNLFTKYDYKSVLLAATHFLYQIINSIDRIIFLLCSKSINDINNKSSCIWYGYIITREWEIANTNRWLHPMVVSQQIIPSMLCI